MNFRECPTSRDCPKRGSPVYGRLSGYIVGFMFWLCRKRLAGS
jgi:hypothetical protein